MSIRVEKHCASCLKTIERGRFMYCSIPCKERDEACLRLRKVQHGS